MSARDLDLSDVVSIKTIAERFGVGIPTVSNWATAGRRGLAEFPKPLDVPGAYQKLFSWEEVQEWHKFRKQKNTKRLQRKAERLAQELEQLNALISNDEG